jgi:hypothetical protein
VQITSSLKNAYQNITRSIGEAVVGDDFSRQDGTVDGIVLGASAGAAIGGAVGGVRGLYQQAQNSVSERQVHKSITVPRLEGHSYSVRADWDTDCDTHGEHTHCDRELDGWWHTYRPNVRERVVGGFSEPTLQNSHQSTFVSAALTGAAIGAGLGAGIGLATGVISRLAGGHPMRRKPLPPELREQLVANAGETVMKSTAIGAGVGAAVGLGAGLLEASGAISVERTWDTPVFESRSLGNIPRNHYEWNRSWGWSWPSPGDYRDHSPRGERTVVRQAPVLDRSGEPMMRPVTRQLNSARLGPLSGLIGGAAVGAGVGFAAGIASSVVNRVLVQSGME